MSKLVCTTWPHPWLSSLYITIWEEQSHIIDFYLYRKCSFPGKRRDNCTIKLQVGTRRDRGYNVGTVPPESGRLATMVWAWNKERFDLDNTALEQWKRVTWLKLSARPSWDVAMLDGYRNAVLVSMRTSYQSSLINESPDYSCSSEMQIC